MLFIYRRFFSCIHKIYRILFLILFTKILPWSKTIYFCIICQFILFYIISFLLYLFIGSLARAKKTEVIVAYEKFFFTSKIMRIPRFIARSEESRMSASMIHLCIKFNLLERIVRSPPLSFLLSARWRPIPL